MSEYKDQMEEARRGAETESAPEAPRRRRRADRYREEEQERYTDEPVLESGSETAREVANRYRQQQELARQAASREETARIAARGSLSARDRDAQPRERVGYASGHMGLSAQDRARMSEAGRARLAEESQMRAARREEFGGIAGDGRNAGRNRTTAGDPRLAGKPVIDRREEPRRRGGKVLLILLIAVLILGVLAGAVLLSPEDGPLGGLKQSLNGLLGRSGENGGESSPAISFTAGSQDRAEAPANLEFFALTGKEVGDIRLLSEDGEPLISDNLRYAQDSGLLWEISWYAEEPYEGMIRLQVLLGEIWTDTGLEVRVVVQAPGTEAAEEAELPVVFATDEPAGEDAPTEEPEEAGFAEDDQADPEREGTGENDQPDASPEGAETENSPESAEDAGNGADPETAEGGEDSGTEETPDEGENSGIEETPDAAEAAEDPEAQETAANGEDPEAAEAAEGGENPDTLADADDPGEGWDESAAEDPDAPEAAERAEETGESENAGEQAGSLTADAEPPAGGEESEAAQAEPAEKKIFTVSAAEGADPGLISTITIYNGTKKVVEYARSDKEKIHMPGPGEYTRQKMGVLTFRSDAFRQNSAVGTVKGMDSLTNAWKAEAGSVKGSGQTYYGIGWVGQPAIVKWSKEVREQSDIYDSKKEKSGLKEVIAAGQDGRIYFLDLSDGAPTRNSIKLGYPMRAAPSVHPGGAPYMTVGQFARKMNGHTGTIGLRQYNLYNMKELSLIDGLDGKNNRPYNKVGSFETSALIDRTTGCMVTAGTNGMLYLINLNSEFDYGAGTYTQSATTVAMRTKAKGEKDAATAVEASVAMYDHYVYYVDMGGFLRCVDTNNLAVCWAVSLGDSVESTPALDWRGEDGLDLYAATELSARKSGDAEVICLDALTGETRWTAAFGVKKDTKNKTASGFKASPVVGQNGLSEYVYYTVNNLSDEGREKLGLGKETAALIALRKEDGQVAWAVGLSGRGYSSPVAVYDEEGNGAVIQCAGDGSILMLDGLTGKERASLQIDGAIEASPAVYDGMMVIGTTEKNKNNIYGIRIE